MGTMMAHLHSITSIKAVSAHSTSWVGIKGDGGSVTLFVDVELARRLQQAFDDYENAQAREDAARAVK